MKTLKWKELPRCIEFYVYGGPYGERQVASLIPVNDLVEVRHQALAALICFDPALLHNREMLQMLARQFGLHPIFVVKQADQWRTDLWCSIEEVLDTPLAASRST